MGREYHRQTMIGLHAVSNRSWVLGQIAAERISCICTGTDTTKVSVAGEEKRDGGRGWAKSHGVEEPSSEAMLATPTSGSQMVQGGINMVRQEAIGGWTPVVFKKIHTVDVPSNV